MENFISVEALPVGRFLSGMTKIALPWFQRAYAWGPDHAGRLLADILRACKSERGRYSLGQIRLARAKGSTVASLIDGHQRTITLTILFALLRDLSRIHDPAEADALDRMIAYDGPGGRMPRLQPQAQVASLFGEFVQQPGGSLQAFTSIAADSNHSARNIIENRASLFDKLQTLDIEERRALARFLIENCWVVVTSVEDEDEAWSMLVDEEDTGLPFHTSERSKVTLISIMPESHQVEAGQIWERAQTDLTSNGIEELLSHLRTLRLKRRSSNLIDRDLIESYRLDKDGLAFMRGVFSTHSQRVVDIFQRRIGSGVTQTRVGSMLDSLSWLGERHWMPPLLHWLDVFPDRGERLVQFVTALDRLAWMLRIAGADPVEFERTMNRVLRAIDGSAPEAAMAALQVERKLLADAGRRLREQNFYRKHCCDQVMRRLSRALGHEHGPVDGKYVTIEHILPRNPGKDTRWIGDFGKANIPLYANRLGNLTYLSFDDNAACGNRDFVGGKLDVYRMSSFAMTRQVAGTSRVWTREAIDARSEALIATLARDLGLPRL